MAPFPMCVELTDRLVILVGSGEQIRDKAQKLAVFGAKLRQLERLNEADLDEHPAFVIAGDLSEAQAEEVAALCARRKIPLNVVDVPRLCTFTFPSLIVRGDLAISVSTGGKAPGAAAHIRRIIERALPAQIDRMLCWLGQVRREIRAAHPPRESKAIMALLTGESFEKGRPLTQEECSACIAQGEEAVRGRMETQ